MAKVEGLNLREGRWHVLIVIPDDLKATYKKDRVNPALGTFERRETTLLDPSNGLSGWMNLRPNAAP